MSEATEPYVAEPTSPPVPGGDELARMLAAAGEQLEFNAHLGLRTQAAWAGHAEILLPRTAPTGNHVGTVHAVALPAPAELAGAVAAGSRLPELVIRGWFPVAAGFNVRFHTPANGDVVAIADVPEDLASAQDEALATSERVKVAVEVALLDGEERVATVTIHYVFLPPTS